MATFEDFSLSVMRMYARHATEQAIASYEVLTKLGPAPEAYKPPKLTKAQLGAKLRRTRKISAARKKIHSLLKRFPELVDDFRVGDDD